MRVATLTRLRWLSAAGQLAACVFVAWGLWFPFPIGACLALIALSVAVNLVLTLRLPPSHRLSPRTSFLVFAFDILQPAALMFMTGGITNPFAIFLILPGLVAAATQPALSVAALSLVSILAASVLALVHLPLPWAAGDALDLPGTYVAGFWFAIVTTIVFTTFYVHRVAAEARLLADALGATELVLEREQHLSALDGLAAAAAHELGTPLGTIAVVAGEMARAIPQGDPRREDVDLLLSQSQRCREILRRLTNPSLASAEHERPVPVGFLVQEAVRPHRTGGAVSVETRTVRRAGAEPGLWRGSGVVYGLGNIVENAADFARGEVDVLLSWSEAELCVLVRDDGPGFSADTLGRIGDPYVSRRENGGSDGGGNLGLGLFIARTLLERSGATLAFRNRQEGSGAEVEIVWPRERLPRMPAGRRLGVAEPRSDGAPDPSAIPAE